MGAFLLRNPAIPLAVILAIALTIVCLVARSRGLERDAAVLRATTLEQQLDQALDERRRLDEALAQRAEDEAKSREESERARASINTHRNTESDREIGPVLRGYLDAVRGAK